jgi:O-antigen/teichoic acid export membrane protein
LGAPFAVIALVGWLGGYGNNYLIQLILPSVEVARFTFVLSISSIMLLVATALNQVWNPTFYRITHERTVVEVEAKNRRFYRAQAAVLGLVGAVVVLSFPLAIRAVGGNLMAYESSRAELALLLGTYIVQSPGWHCQNYFLAYGRGSELMRICMTAGGLAIVTTAALMLSLGPMGIYLGVFSQAAARTAGTVYGARRRWPVRVSWGGVVIGLSVLAIAYAVGPS